MAAGVSLTSEHGVGRIDVQIDGEARNFDIIGGIEAGTGWVDQGPRRTVTLMGRDATGADSGIKIRFLMDAESRQVRCSPADTILEYRQGGAIHRLNPGPECGALSLDTIETADDGMTLHLEGRFAGRFEGLGDNPAAYTARNGRFRADVAPFGR
ncbi:MAG: hypothetical protein RID91_12455 [Azospirillaceae bacterium]